GRVTGGVTWGGSLTSAASALPRCTACVGACSFRHRLCVEAVEGGGKTTEDAVLAAIDAADRAWDTIVDSLGAPPPDGDDDGVWHVQLRDAVDGGGEAEMLARLATPCAAGGPDVPAFQALPERTVIDPVSATYERGASAFFAWLDRSFGTEPGALVLGLWSLAPTRTSIDASRWAGSPTGFDVLRKSLRDRLWAGSTLD